ncbi:MAG: hypothetical protein ABFS12_09775 [Bacteroidota bacterium]
MKNNILIVSILSIFILKNVNAQESANWKSEIGINLFQLPATTIDLNYRITNNPRYTVSINSGYTFNYSNSYDLVGFFLSPHSKCANEGYKMTKQSGGFINLGINYNFRKSFQKNNYFFIGASINNSFISEYAEYQDLEIQGSQVEKLDHDIYLFGFSGIVGYNFKIFNKLSSDLGLKISIPNSKFKELYGYENYIPGMGFMDTCNSNNVIFPLIFLNLKYEIN